MIYVFATPVGVFELLVVNPDVAIKTALFDAKRLDLF
jgi:hypothetical protein